MLRTNVVWLNQGQKGRRVPSPTPMPGGSTFDFSCREPIARNKMLPEMGHSNTTEAFLKAICTKMMLFFFFLVNWVIVRIKKKKKSVIVSMNKRALKTSKI